jgi:hypothetical protein
MHETVAVITTKRRAQLQLVLHLVTHNGTHVTRTWHQSKTFDWQSSELTQQ